MSPDADARGPAVALDDPSWRTALERVLAGEGLTVVAQPIIDVAHARVGGYELLSRFAGPPSAPPDVWFAAARRHGLDGELTACTVRAMHSLVAGRPQATFWTMNVEPHLLPLPAVREAVCGHGRLDEVVVELTEHVEAEDDAALEEVLTEIRALGGRIAMDDAGTGYSGLSQMLSLRPDVVKLDRSLVTGLDRDPVRRTVVRLLGDLSGQMDAWLLAEGVETRAELAELVDLGVPLVQGWAVGRPAPGWPALDDLTRTFLREQVARSRVGAHVLTLVRPARVRPAADWEAGACTAEDVL
ncbi:EAL domain-containing protein, partial [Actinotalea sp. C106]|uniref:EAL domain-containing protein n=1 Tax=Actinotalea sp. C106 TaxID=2908644 RepID=UPI002028DAB0